MDAVSATIPQQEAASASRYACMGPPSAATHGNQAPAACVCAPTAHLSSTLNSVRCVHNEQEKDYDTTPPWCLPASAPEGANVEGALVGKGREGAGKLPSGGGQGATVLSEVVVLKADASTRSTKVPSQYSAALTGGCFPSSAAHACCGRTVGEYIGAVQWAIDARPPCCQRIFSTKRRRRDGHARARGG
jgi:hypothetical protein